MDKHYDPARIEAAARQRWEDAAAAVKNIYEEVLRGA